MHAAIQFSPRDERRQLWLDGVGGGFVSARIGKNMALTMTSDEIREAFLSYFEGKGHLRVASSSLIPVGDPTLLLTIAGMNQFKPYFSGQSSPPKKRLTSAQKCFRTPDIDIVGDATHNTLFEMLGNFSIGDYFKREAIEYALEFLSDRLGLLLDRLFITVHKTDDEAHKLWQDIGIPGERIYRFGDKDNWWGPPIHGDEGPCGPCSELHYDFGIARGCGSIDCAPNCENVMHSGEKCDRFVELWNLVFMQFYHRPDGSRDPLPAPSIDTGMGLERATLVVQGTGTMYETDLFAPLVKTMEEISGVSYGNDISLDYAIRAVVEHGRSSTFLTADGVVPGNEGRGYVLRRVIRRAIRHGRRLGIDRPFLWEIAEGVINRMSHNYPELDNHREFIATVLRLEEERFQHAYQNGQTILEEALHGAKALSDEVVFRLWDTYGFPVEMTQEIALERGVDVDLVGFNRQMEVQRKRARATSQFGGAHGKIRVYESLGVGATKFLGYDRLTGASIVVGLISDGDTKSEILEDSDAEIVLVETPFYPEGGGQVGDSGQLIGPTGKVSIRDTQTVIPDLIVHFGKVTEGTVAIGQTLESYVDPVQRDDTARNHTATHLLHAALRQILGPHVRQAGSLVTPSRLRFDFSHIQAMTEEELWKVQFMVNEKIRQNAHIMSSQDTYSGAISRGALAFFGDKYGETVRLIEIANGDTFSFEVCGGTHVSNTGEVGSVYVLGESSIGAGMRRIEAVSGRAAERMVWERFSVENRIVSSLQTTQPNLEARVQELQRQVELLQNERGDLEARLALQSAVDLVKEKKRVRGIDVISVIVSASNDDILRRTADWLKDQLKTGVVVLGSIINERPRIVVMVTTDLVKRGIDAREVAKGVAGIIGGGGGGRADVAQAGGRATEKLKEALNSVDSLVSQSLKDID